jgi:hypothetical protein
MTLLLASVGVLFGTINYLSIPQTMMLMLTFACLNFACAAASTAHWPGWRPQFKYYSPLLAAAGGCACIALMFFTSTLWAVITIALVVLVVWHVVRFGPSKREWGPATAQHKLSLAVSWLAEVNRDARSSKNYRPNALLMLGPPGQRGRLAKFGELVAKGGGVVTAVDVLVGDISRLPDYEQRRRQALAVCKPALFPVTLVAPSVRQAVQTLMQAGWSRAFEPNLLVLGFHANWRSDDPNKAHNHGVGDALSHVQLLAKDKDEARVIEKAARRVRAMSHTLTTLPAVTNALPSSLGSSSFVSAFADLSDAPPPPPPPQPEPAAEIASVVEELRKTYGNDSSRLARLQGALEQSVMSRRVSHVGLPPGASRRGSFDDDVSTPGTLARRISTPAASLAMAAAAAAASLERSGSLVRRASMPAARHAHLAPDAFGGAVPLVRVRNAAFANDDASGDEASSSSTSSSSSSSSDEAAADTATAPSAERDATPPSLAALFAPPSNASTPNAAASAPSTAAVTSAAAASDAPASLAGLFAAHDADAPAPPAPKTAPDTRAPPPASLGSLFAPFGDAPTPVGGSAGASVNGDESDARRRSPVRVVPPASAPIERKQAPALRTAAVDAVVRPSGGRARHITFALPDDARDDEQRAPAPRRAKRVNGHGENGVTKTTQDDEMTHAYEPAPPAPAAPADEYAEALLNDTVCCSAAYVDIVRDAFSLQKVRVVCPTRCDAQASGRRDCARVEAAQSGHRRCVVAGRRWRVRAHS